MSVSGPLSIHPPVFCDELPGMPVSRKMPPPTAGSRTLADLPVALPFKRAEGRANHQLGNRFGCEIAALALLLRWRVLSQVELVRLTQDTDGDVREVKVGPLSPSSRETVGHPAPV